jgi:hypothetical protein
MSDTVTQARQQSGAVAEEATQEARQLAETAKDQATTVARNATEQVGVVASEAKEQAENVMRYTRGQLRAQADEQAAKVAGSLHRFSDELRALAEGRVDEAGTARRYLQEMGGQLDQFAQRVDTRGYQGVVDDMQGFARRRPGAFLAIAAGAGFLAGRLFRSVKDEQDAGGTESTGFRPYGEIPGQAATEASPAWETS